MPTPKTGSENAPLRLLVPQLAVAACLAVALAWRLTHWAEHGDVLVVLLAILPLVQLWILPFVVLRGLRGTV